MGNIEMRLQFRSNLLTMDNKESKEEGVYRCAKMAFQKSGSNIIALYSRLLSESGRTRFGGKLAIKRGLQFETCNILLWPAIMSLCDKAVHTRSFKQYVMVWFECHGPQNIGTMEAWLDLSECLLPFSDALILDRVCVFRMLLISGDCLSEQWRSHTCSLLNLTKTPHCVVD